MKTTCAAIALCILTLSGFAAHTNSLTGSLGIDVETVYSKREGVMYVRGTFPSDFVDATFANGTNANQMTHLVAESGSLTNGQSVAFDLSEATNCFGDAIAFSRVNFLAVKGGTNNTGALQVLPAASEGLVSPFEDDTGSEGLTIRPGGAAVLWAPDATGYTVATNADGLVISNNAAEPDGLYAAPGLAIDAVDTAFQTTNAVTWAMNGEYWSLAATTNLTFSNADTINVDSASNVCYGVWRIQAATNGTVSTVAPSTNQTYITATGAVAALPAVSANNIGLGYLLVSTVNASNTFTANTSSLTETNATFYDATATTPASQAWELYIGGVAE